jgi:DNA-binding transcriptional LysR family regulator
MNAFRNMQVFVAVAQASSFRQAALTLGLPSSTVSRRIADLERDVGLRLLHRTTRRVELTEGGRQYFDHCRRIVQDAELAYRELTQLQSRPRGVIRASMPVDFSVAYLSPMLADFARLYPDIRFQLDLSPAQADLTAGLMDVAIRMAPPKEPHLIARRIATLDIGLFAAPGYLGRHGQPSTPQELQAHQCLCMREGPWILRAADGSREEAVPMAGRFVVNNVGLLRQLALSGLGIMATCRDWAADDIARGALVRVLPGWSPPPVDAYAITATRLLPAKDRVFIDYLVQRMARPG